MQNKIPAHFAFSVARYRNQFEQDAELIQQILSGSNHAAAINIIGLILLDQQQYSQAQALFEQAIELAADEPVYYSNLAILYQEQHQFSLAEQYFRQADHLAPNQSAHKVNLAYSLQQQNQFSAAIPLYQAALPNSEQTANIYLNLGKCLDETGNLFEAAECYAKALAIEPEQSLALYNLAGVHERQGDHKTAIAYYRQTLALQPEFIQCQFNLAIALMNDNTLDEAEQAFKQVLTLEPDYFPALRTLADCYAYQGFIEQAKDYYQQALTVQNNTGIAIRLATLLPIIPCSSEQIDIYRVSLKQALPALLAKHDLSISDPVSELRDAFFYLSYHGLNNRELKTQLHQILSQACPSLLWTAPHCLLPRVKKPLIKIGLISKYFYQHSIGKTSQGLFAQLPKQQFKLYALFIPPVIDDELSDFIKRHADEVRVLSSTLATARTEIAALELDILFYQDIGMEPFSYFLAYSRLAPMQCTSFGHPDTTGIANMDYFISCALFETEHAENHYSEKLYQLPYPSLLSYYYRPELPKQLKTREDFGFSDQDHLYCCPQSLFKFHPDFDAILAGILRADSDGKLIVLAGTLPELKRLLYQRWLDTMPDVIARIVFLPALPFTEFSNLLAVVDVVLDIPQFNGMNSSLEAFNVGCPIVTLPGSLQRSRHGAGLYGKMAMTDCIAQDAADYVAIALRLANDKVFYQDVHSKILEQNHLLFNDQSTISALTEFLTSA